MSTLREVVPYYHVLPEVLYGRRVSTYKVGSLSTRFIHIQVIFNTNETIREYYCGLSDSVLSLVRTSCTLGEIREKRDPER